MSRDFPVNLTRMPKRRSQQRTVCPDYSRSKPPEQVALLMEEGEIWFDETAVSREDLLDKINWRIHQFLDSCAGGKAEELETELLDIPQMVYQIDRRD